MEEFRVRVPKNQGDSNGLSPHVMIFTDSSLEPRSMPIWG